MEFVKRFVKPLRCSYSVAFSLTIGCIFLQSSMHAASDYAGARGAKMIELGRSLFSDVSLSRDGTTSCSSCHDPDHAYADPRSRSTGVGQKVGTRNAPSLVGIGSDQAFFWDGRRARLEDVVADPFTNPVELGWPSAQALIENLSSNRALANRFRSTFPEARNSITLYQVERVLAAFVRSLPSNTSVFDQAIAQRRPLPPMAELGRHLFTDVAKCSECHLIEGKGARFSDGGFHHSGIEQATQSEELPQLANAVLSDNLDVTHLGPKVLTDKAWSALGRFVVTHKPVDIGAFRTPSLRNVAVTAPYMHDGSIATLGQAVDHEIYYRGFSRGHPVTLSAAERAALIAFLETLTDASYAPALGSIEAANKE